MHYSKFLTLAISIMIMQRTYAACNGANCFNDGIDFAKQVPYGSISNSIIESAVGKEKFTEAVVTKDNLANQMGGEFRNVDKMSNAGNQKLQNCVGKSSSDCNAVSYYNDPLMRQKQQGIESSVGIASYLLNKQIQQDVDFSSYCKNNPNDSMCKMCQENPNQSMCQNGNKCTTITYQTTEGGQQSFSCEIVGQRNYSCSKWIDDVQFHVSTETCDPRDSSCNSLRNNKSCIKINNAVFNYSCDSSNRKTSNLYCPYWDNVQTGGGGGNFVWGTCNWGATYNLAGIPTTAQCGINQGNPSPSWHVFYDVIIYETYQCTVIDHVIWKDNCSK